jgi:hypothetical protein
MRYLPQHCVQEQIAQTCHLSRLVRIAEEARCGLVRLHDYRTRCCTQLTTMADLRKISRVGNGTTKPWSIQQLGD